MNKQDKDLLGSMCENEKHKFNLWFCELNKAHSKTKHYGDGDLTDLTGIHCWFDYFVDGYTAEEAISEDFSALN